MSGNGDSRVSIFETTSRMDGKTRERLGGWVWRLVA